MCATGEPAQHNDHCRRMEPHHCGKLHSAK
jgi:hypothetical protein